MAADGRRQEQKNQLRSRQKKESRGLSEIYRRSSL